MAEQAAHCEHLARRAAEEDTHGWKLRGRKLKAPQDKAGHKTRKVSTTDPQSGVMSTAKGSCRATTPRLWPTTSR